MAARPTRRSSTSPPASPPIPPATSISPTPSICASARSPAAASALSPATASSVPPVTAGPRTTHRWTHPWASRWIRPGSVYISDTFNNAVRKVGADGTISLFAGGSGDTLSHPQGLAVDSSGNLYVTDSDGSRVRKYSPSGSGSTVAGSGTQGFGGDGGSATSAQLYTPSGIAVDSAGNVYIADFDNNRVRRVSSAASSPVAGSGAPGTPATAAPPPTPGSTLLGRRRGCSRQRLHRGYRQQPRARRSPAGTIHTFAGNGLAGYYRRRRPRHSAQVGNPEARRRCAGNLYVTDGSSRVRKIFTSGLILTIAGNGTQGYSGDGGNATSATAHAPSAVAVDAAGNVYVADSNNNAVRLLSPRGFGLP